MFFGATSFNQPLDKWVNTQTGFLSNDAQEEFNFTSQSLLDYVGDTSIKDSFFNPRGTLKSLENKEFPDARVCGNGEIGQPKAPDGKSQNRND